MEWKVHAGNLWKSTGAVQAPMLSKFCKCTSCPRCTLSSSKLTRIWELRCQDQPVRFMPLIWRQLASIQEWFLNKDDMTKYHGRSDQFTQPMNPCGSLILEVSEWVDAEEEEIIKRGGNVEKVFPVKGHKFVPTVKFCGIIITWPWMIDRHSGNRYFVPCARNSFGALESRLAYSAFPWHFVWLLSNLLLSLLFWAIILSRDFLVKGARWPSTSGVTTRSSTTAQKACESSKSMKSFHELYFDHVWICNIQVASIWKGRGCEKAKQLPSYCRQVLTP